MSIKLPRGPTLEEIGKAAVWLVEDAVDDFYPDVVGYADIPNFAANNSELQGFVENYSQGEGSCKISVPKSPLLSRQTVWIPPAARLRYLTLLSRLMGPVSKGFSTACYSYRPSPRNQRPFSGAAAAWLKFRSDFREAAQTAPWCIITDLSAYFDHLSAARLVEGLVTLSSTKRDDQTYADLEDLQTLLEWFTSGKQGIPQNSDASSFLASVYLSDIDELVANDIPGVRIFRYSDDIRIVAPSRGLAIRALNELQSRLGQRELFLNSAKTRLLPPNSDDWNDEMNGAHDQQLALIDRSISQSGLLPQSLVLECEMTILGLRAANEERLVRAYCNRLLRAKQDDRTKARTSRLVQDVLIWGLRSHPGKSREWCEMASKVMTPALEADLLSIVEDHNYNTHPWIEMWISKALGSFDTPGPRTAKFFSKLAFGSGSPFLRAWGVWGLYRLRDQRGCLRACEEYLDANQPSPLIRAATMAASALEKGRDRQLGRSEKLGAFSRSLVKYITGRGGQQPTAPKRSISVFSAGLVPGGFKRFRLSSTAGFDY